MIGPHSPSRHGLVYRRDRFKSGGRAADAFSRGEPLQVKRVLIVDDSRLARMALRKSLPPSLSTEVTEAGSGSEALRHIEASRFDLMFLDLTMPDGNGYELLKTLQDTGRTFPTIVVSADVQTMAVERVIKLGAIALVKKSFK